MRKLVRKAIGTAGIQFTERACGGKKEHCNTSSVMSTRRVAIPSPHTSRSSCMRRLSTWSCCRAELDAESACRRCSSSICCSSFTNLHTRRGYIYYIAIVIAGRSLAFIDSKCFVHVMLITPRVSIQPYRGCTPFRHRHFSSNSLLFAPQCVLQLQHGTTKKSASRTYTARSLHASTAL